MPRTKKMKRAMNLRAYHERQAAERAARLNASSDNPPPTSPSTSAPPTPILSAAPAPIPSAPSTPVAPAPSPPPVLPELPELRFTEPPMQPFTLQPPPNTGSDEATRLDPALFSKYMAPPLELVRQAIPVLEARVNPRRKSGIGHKKSDLSPLALKDPSSVLELFRIYTIKDITWAQASIDISLAKGHGKAHAATLRAWGRGCLRDPTFIPRVYGAKAARSTSTSSPTPPPGEVDV